jgi:hypothetical protein
MIQSKKMIGQLEPASTFKNAGPDIQDFRFLMSLEDRLIEGDAARVQSRRRQGHQTAGMKRQSTAEDGIGHWFLKPGDKN